jgi:hypothetical protein
MIFDPFPDMKFTRTCWRRPDADPHSAWVMTVAGEVDANEVQYMTTVIPLSGPVPGSPNIYALCIVQL